MRILPLLAAVLLLLAACSGSGDRPPASPAAAAPPASVPAAPTASAPAAPAVAVAVATAADLPADPALRQGVLANGLRYAAMRQAQPPGKLSLRLRVASGSMNESDAQRGLAHYLEHMAFNGTTRFPPGELVRRLQAAGLAFGAHTNAHTSYDETVYKLDLPDTRPETIDLALSVLVDQVVGMLLLPEEVERERGVILAEMRDRDGPEYRGWKALSALRYAGTSIPDRSPIGIEATIRAATPELLREYYERWYQPAQMVLSAVGDIDPAELEPALRRHLGALAAKRPAAADRDAGRLTPDPRAASAVEDAEADGLGVELVRVYARPRPAEGLAPRRAQYLTDMAESILNKRIARIAEAAGDGPLLGGGGFSYQWLGHYQAGVQGQARPGQAAAALAILVREARRMLDHGPTDAEWTAQVAAARASLDQGVEGAASRSNARLADEIYDQLAEGRQVLSPAQQREIYGGILAGASAADAHAAFRAAWRADDLAAGRTAIRAYGRQPGASAEALAALIDWSTPVPPPAAESVLAWTYPEPPAQRPEAPAADADGVVHARIGDMPVIIRASRDQPGQVMLRLTLHQRTYPRPPAAAELAAMTFFAGGLGAFTADELRRLFPDSSVSMAGPSIGPRGIGFGFGCRPSDLALGCRLLRAHLADPGWRPEATQRAIAVWREALIAQASDLDAQAGIAADEATAGREPWRRRTTLAEVDALGAGDGRAWLAPFIAAAPRSVVVVGDIDPAAALAAVATYLAADRPAPAVAASAAEARAALDPTPAWTPGAIAITVPGQVARDVVLVRWPTDDIYDIGRTRRLQLLAQVFADRLRDELREALGKAYSPYVGAMAGDDWRGWGYVQAAASVERGQGPIALAAIQRLAEEMRAQPPGDDLFARVRAPILKQLASLRTSNAWWAGTVLGQAAVQPFRQAWAGTLVPDYTAATAAEVHALAREYLVQDRQVAVMATCPGAAAAPATAAEVAP